MKRSLGPQTILYPHPVLLIGSYGEGGRPNVMTASWAGICCSKPACVAIALRKATLTYHNIVQSRAFTVGIPCKRLVREADYVGTVSGRDVDKFATSGLTPIDSEIVNAPYVGECPVVLECALVRDLELGLHTLFIGEIHDVKADQDVLGKRNLPDITKVAPLAYASGSRAYFEIGAQVQEGFVTRELE